MKLNNKFPVKLKVTFNRKRRYYPYQAKYDQTVEGFKNIFANDAKGELKKIRNVLVSEELRANEIVGSLGNRFSFTLFEKAFKNPSGHSTNIFSLLKDLANKLRQNEQISTAVLTECTLNSLKKFHPKNELSLDEIDTDFLNRYERWMLQEGNSKATIGMYLRRVRVIFNTGIADRVIPIELYPFGTKNNNFHIPVGRNFKKALSHADVGLIYNYMPKTNNEAKAKDLWLFSYLGNGMNMKDIALLKFKNIDGDMIRFERAKTIRANKDKPVVISFSLSADIKQIIKKWGNKSIYDGNYIFPILDNKATAEEQYKMIYNAVKTTNKHMRAICKDLGITANVTTYVARHSFSTIVRNSGKSIEFVGEQLGHSSTKTTQGYMGNFEDHAKKEVAEVLINFPQTGTY